MAEHPETQAPGSRTYYDCMEQEGIYPNGRNLKFYLENVLFSDVDLKGKRVLDIGGGNGVFSLYAAVQGAARVICLEPESSGSKNGMIKSFARVRERLHLGDRITLEPATLQAFYSKEEAFDVILSHNSINHLDENACIHLLESVAARKTYAELLSKIYQMTERGGRLIVCDASRYNLFAKLHVRNPIAPSIEWHKHQAPEFWTELLEEVGFMDPKIIWNSFNTLGHIGRVFLGNRLMSYMLHSHFCLKMTRPA